MAMDLKKVYNKAYSGYGNDKTLIGIFRNAYKDDYAEEATPYSYISKKELQRIVELLNVSEGQTIVDLGCGHGGPGLWVARETGTNLIGIDISETAIEKAKKRTSEFDLVGKARFQVGDICETGLSSSAYEGVMSIDALFYASDKAAAMNEVARIIKQNSFFIFTTWEDHTKREYSPFLEKAGFEIMVYEEVPDWKRRQREVQEGILASKDILIDEMTESVAKMWLSDAKLGLEMIDYLRRIFVVARKK